MSEAKLISYTLNDFSTEIEMESFLHFMEKNGDEMYNKLKIWTTALESQSGLE